MGRKKIACLALAALLLAGIVLLATQREALDAAALAVWFRGLPGWGAPLLFICLYALGTVFFLPGSVLTLVGGALFGPWLGTLYSLSGATLGALLSFLVSRHLAADWVRRQSGARLIQLIEGVEGEGWRFVAFTRLVPLFPFNLLNYALGLTRIPLPVYALTTVVCMVPGALAYTWLGHAGKEAATGGEGLIRTALIALALLAAALFLPRLVARWRSVQQLAGKGAAPPAG